MFKKIMIFLSVAFLMASSLHAQSVGDSRFLWVHNFQFFQYDYKIGATLQAIGEDCNVWVENNLITAITVDPVTGTLYAGTKSSGVLTRNTGEEKWQFNINGLPRSSRLTGLAKIHCLLTTTKGTILAGTDDGLFRYDKTADRWRNVTISTPVFNLVEHDEVLFAGLGGHLWADDSDEDSDVDINMGVFTSTDDGISWNRNSAGLPFDNDNELLPVYSLEKSNGHVFASTDAGIFTTKNQGKYWEAVEKTLTAAPANIKVKIEDSSLDEDKLAAIGESIGKTFDKWLAVEGLSNEDKLVLVKYDEAGNVVNRWFCPKNTILNTDPLYLNRNIPGIVGDAGKFIAKLNYYTQDQTTEYYPDYTQLNINELTYRGEAATGTIVDTEKELLLVVSFPENPNFEVGGKFITVKYVANGDTLVWSQKSISLRGLNKDKKGIILSNEKLISGNPVSNYDLLNNADIVSSFIVTTTSGLTFDKMAYSSNLGIIFAGNSDGVYNTTNQGISWNLVGSTTEGLENTSIKSLYISNEGTLFAGTADGVFKSEDNGASWTACGIIDAFTEVNSIVNYNNIIYLGTPYGFYQSTDNGINWTSHNIGNTAYVKDAEINALLNNFDNVTPSNPAKGIYSTITEEFGADKLPDFDKNPKINLVLHNIIEKGETENTTSNGSYGASKISAYFRAEDQNHIGNTNKGEFIFVDAKESTDIERAKAVAHQLLRMMIWNSDYDEESWIAEGISFYAERICGYPVPVAMPDFQTLTGANKVFSLVAGTPLSPWSVTPDGGDMNNRYTMVSMFTTFLFENFGGYDLLNTIINDPVNGWIGVQNSFTDKNIKFADVFAAWTIANSINDITKKDPITGAFYGYNDSTYSAVLNRYIAEKGLGMNYGTLFGHNTSMSDIKEYSVNPEFREGLNNWAYIIRYFFPDPSTSDPVRKIVNYWGKDAITKQPINYRINAGDNSHLTVQLIKVKDSGEKDVENITSLFNNEKELQFNVLSKYEPNADTTSLKYRDMYVIISNQDSLGKAAKFVQVKDVTPPVINYEVVHNPIYPEFIEIFISSSEKTFSDVGGEFENPTVEMRYFTDTTRVDIASFDNGKNSAGKDVSYIYNGNYHLVDDGVVDLIIRKLQDLPGNDITDIVTPINVRKLNPQGVSTIASGNNNSVLTLAANSINGSRFITVVENNPDIYLGLKKSKADNITYLSNIFQYGPNSKTLLNDAVLVIKYNKELVDSQQNFGLYKLQDDQWVSVAAIHDEKQSTLTASVNELGTFAVLQGNLPGNNKVTDLAIPQDFAVLQNYPNPFNPSTEIKYQLPTANQVSIKIFNMNGQLVNTLVNEQKEAGFYQVTWNGLNSAGSKVSSGVYLYEMKAGSFVETRKMILIK